MKNHKHLPLHPTDDVIGPQHQAVRHTVAHQYPGQQHVAQLPSGSSNYGRVVVVDEHPQHERGDEDAGGAEGHCSDCPPAVRHQVLLRNVHAADVGGVRNGSLGA